MGIVTGWAVVNVETGIVENTILWDGEGDLGFGAGFELVQSDIARIGDSYSNGIFTPAPPAPLTPEQILARQSAILQSAIQLAAAQKTALAERISQINDAIDFGDATVEEEAELPVRTAQLAEWKRYATLLGRVTAQSGWYETVVWPVQPAEGMDLTVSAVAPTTMQAS